jgi:membrane protease subunit HflC
LLSRIGDTQNRVIGQHTFSEFVNSDASQVKIGDIEQEMLTTLREPVLTDYGIEIVTLGIKQLNVNEDVTQKVFGRMRAERERRTTETLAQGKAQASKIEKDADTKRRALEAAAEARATAIRGQGDAEAASYYELLREDPDFAMFLRETEALRKILEKRSTVILSGDSEPIRLLKGMPSIKPKKN